MKDTAETSAAMDMQIEGESPSKREESVLLSRPGSSDGDVSGIKSNQSSEKESPKFRIDTTIWPIQPIQKRISRSRTVSVESHDSLGDFIGDLILGQNKALNRIPDILVLDYDDSGVASASSSEPSPSTPLGDPSSGFLSGFSSSTSLCDGMSAMDLTFKQQADPNNNLNTSPESIAFNNRETNMREVIKAMSGLTDEYQSAINLAEMPEEYLMLDRPRSIRHATEVLSDDDNITVTIYPSASTPSENLCYASVQASESNQDLPAEENPSEAEHAKKEPSKVEAMELIMEVQAAKVEPAKVEPSKVEPLKEESAKIEHSANEELVKAESVEQVNIIPKRRRSVKFDVVPKIIGEASESEIIHYISKGSDIQNMDSIFLSKPVLSSQLSVDPGPQPGKVPSVHPTTIASSPTLSSTASHTPSNSPTHSEQPPPTLNQQDTCSTAISSPCLVTQPLPFTNHPQSTHVDQNNWLREELIRSKFEIKGLREHLKGTNMENDRLKNACLRLESQLQFALHGRRHSSTDSSSDGSLTSPPLQVTELLYPAGVRPTKQGPPHTTQPFPSSHSHVSLSAMLPLSSNSVNSVIRTSSSSPESLNSFSIDKLFRSAGAAQYKDCSFQASADDVTLAPNGSLMAVDSNSSLSDGSTDHHPYNEFSRRASHGYVSSRPEYDAPEMCPQSRSFNGNIPHYYDNGFMAEYVPRGRGGRGRGRGDRGRGRGEYRGNRLQGFGGGWTRGRSQPVEANKGLERCWRSLNTV